MRLTLPALLLLLAAPAALARQPTGDGDPAERHCMRIEEPTGHLGSGTLCKTNAEWAELTRQGVVLDQFGEPVPPKDARDVAGHGCVAGYGGGPGKDGTRAMRFDCH